MRSSNDRTIHADMRHRTDLGATGTSRTTTPNGSSMTIARTIPAYAMTAVAGWIDAIGILLFFQDLRIFPTYMSGNTTRLFVSVVQEDLQRARLYGAAIVLFVFGAVIGRWVNDGTRWRETIAVLFEAALLFAAALAASRGAPQVLTPGLLAFAMGWNNVALKSSRGAGPKGYITGTLVAFASAVADALAHRGRWSEAVEPAVVWSSLACGALAGAFSTTLMSAAFVLLVPSSVVALCGVIVAVGWLRDGADGS